MSLLEHQTQALLGMASEGPDPTLFALATLLPMSSFPVDSVHGDNRYETTRIQHRQRDGNAHQGKKSPKLLHAYDLPMYTKFKTSELGSDSVEGPKRGKDYISSITGKGLAKCYNILLPIPSSAQSESPDRSSICGEEIWDTMPLLSASTACSDQTACWSLREPADDLGTSGTINSKLLGSAGEPFTMSDSCSDLSPTSQVFTAAYDDMVDERAGDVWNGFKSSYLDSTHPPRTVPSIDIRMPPPLFCPDFSAIHSNESVSGVPIPVELSSFSAMTTSMASDQSTRQPNMPFWEDQAITDRSPKYVESEFDDFLNDMSSAINWDGMEPCLQNEAFGQTDAVNLHHVNGMRGRTLSYQSCHPPQVYRPPGITSSEDVWFTHALSEAESFAAFTQLLNEHHTGLFAAVVEKRWALN